MNKNEGFIELSFSEIVFYINGGFTVFYLYIDDILISEYHIFSEVRDFIFDFYYDLVKSSDVSLEDYCNIFDDYMNDVIHGLIRHQYMYFNYMNHEVQVYYGF